MMLLLAVVPTAASAQGDPFNAPPPRQEREGRRDRGPQYIAAGDFVLVPQGDEMLLVDTKTGCVWTRHPPAQYAAAYWAFEFPSGASDECRKRLSKLRTDAINGIVQ